MAKSLDELKRECDFNPKFIEAMHNKMVVGFTKYGSWKTNRCDVNIKANIDARWEAYQKTGNIEMLEDIANFAMLEWSLPLNPKAHRDGKDQTAPKIKKF